MKQKLRFSPVLAILILLMLTAVAYAVSTFSVRDLAEFRNREVLEDHIVDIGQRFENDYFAMSVNDTTFDGLSYAVALNMESKKAGEFIFVHPKMTAESGGIAYDADVEGYSKYNFMSGFLFPSPLTPTLISDHAAFDGTLIAMDEPYARTPSGPVDWTLTMDVYRVVYKPVLKEMFFTGETTLEEQRKTEEEWRAMCQDAYKNGQIIFNTAGDSELFEYTYYIQPVTGLSEEEYYSYATGDELAAAGALEKVDTIVCQWRTNFGDEPSVASVIGQAIPCNGYQVVLDQFNVTYRQLNCDMHYEFDTALSGDELKNRLESLPTDWDVRINGKANLSHVFSLSTGLEYIGDNSDGSPHNVFRAVGTWLLDEEAETVSFIPCTEDSQNRITEWFPDDAFTVNVATGEITRGGVEPLPDTSALQPLITPEPV